MKNPQEFAKPMEAARATVNTCVMSYLPFDIKYRPERTPAVPKRRFTIASA
jgi:hypothetical protein